MRKKLLSILLLTILVLGYVRIVHADDDVEKEIQELKQKISETQTKEKTLKSEIGSMDDSIKLATLQIDETSRKIERLGKEIIDLGNKINKLESTLSKLSEVLLERIVASYKVRQVSFFSLLISSNGFSDFLHRAKYIETAQAHDRQVLTEVQMTKNVFGEQKTLREEKKLEQETLISLLEEQKEKLDLSKKQKQTLLIQTQNDEATYQKLLQQALAEKQALEAALISGEKVGPVKAGEPIAVVGNTGYPGCSTGAHLHFEIRKDNQWVNPANYLQSKTITNSQDGGEITLGSGDWQWPLGGDIRLTQNFGITPYSSVYKYSGGKHTGLDMVSDNSIIKAPKDGTLYSAVQGCGSSSIIKIKYIDHGDGVVSFYLHVQ